MRVKRLGLRCFGLLIALSLASANAASQDWPVKPLKLVVMASPGGLIDVVARTLAVPLSKNIGQPVVVENRPGAGGNIATDHVAKSTPDGYTLLITSTNHAINQTLLPNPGFDYEKDLAPVSMVAEANQLLFASPSLPANTVAELIAGAKRNPGRVSIAHAAIGTPSHVGAELLASMGAIELVFVGYKSITLAVPDMISGQVQLGIGAVPTVLPLLRSGRLKAIAVTASKRSRMLPDTPTVAESGLPGFDVSAWMCILTTGGTSPQVVQRLSREIRVVMALPEVRDYLDKQDTVAVSSTPAELGETIRAEAVKWAAVLKNAKIKPQ